MKVSVNGKPVSLEEGLDALGFGPPREVRPGQWRRDLPAKRPAVTWTTRQREAWRPASSAEIAGALMPDTRPRESRGGRPVRVRGSRRSTRSSAGSSRGDPDPEPRPPHGRRCHCGCGERIDHLAPQARYLSDAHRKRAARAATAEPPANLLDFAEAIADVEFREHYLVMRLRPNEDELGTVFGRRRLARDGEWGWRTRPNRSEAARLRATYRVIRGAA
jgi:hypothetical protein